MFSAAAWAAAPILRWPAFRRAIFNAIRLRRAETERLRSQDELRFLAYVAAHRDQSQSQILQDLWVLYELAEKRDGYFVEFGATNGRVNSNTWLLENRYGWRGILAEPNPYWHSDIEANRPGPIDKRCVSARSGEMVNFLATDASDPELSAIADFAGGDHFASVRASGQKLQIETVSLNDLLDQHGAPQDIDYISIDTEGSEYDILSHFDFSRRQIKLISVEQNKQTEQSIASLLSAKGYERVFAEYSQWDGWYRRVEDRA